MSLFKRAIKKIILTPLSETFGIPIWCRKPSLNNLDEKLSKYLNFRNGIFIEAGANDGYNQSNTYFLEKGLRWKGLLIEAIPELYYKCKKSRTRSVVLHGGLVSNDYKKSTIKIHYANLMSIAEGAMSPELTASHIKEGIQCQDINDTYKVDVPTLTFKQAVKEAGFSKIDFMSLDLEGYEVQALKGFDFSGVRPTYILIEVRKVEETDSFLSRVGYRRIEKLTQHDYLYQDCNIRSGFSNS